jgi:hypothetical protein
LTRRVALFQQFNSEENFALKKGVGYKELQKEKERDTLLCFLFGRPFCHKQTENIVDIPNRKIQTNLFVTVVSTSPRHRQRVSDTWEM